MQLSSEKILNNMVRNGPEPSNNAKALSDFCDGTFLQSHELFANDDTALKILLYYDDVNLCKSIDKQNTQNYLAILPVSEHSSKISI